MKYLFSIYSLLILMSFQSCNHSESHIVFHPSHELSRVNTPFSAAVETENLLFLSGQIGKNHKTGHLVTGGVMAETEQVIQNIKAVLEQHKLSLDNVIKCTVILKDINDLKDFNLVYASYFKKKPARTTFEASALAGGARIEIDVIAAK
ncbi:Rid family detoxifying hydrolase [Winogradskyella sp.]|nr:Rid family detoxifying hydrolase [Winogradskyella sp.]MDC1506106.1 Rid family detoxifying hydrolase [Winogradskyella sp.]